MTEALQGGPTHARAGPAARVRWLPRQHGAWDMLAVPILLGVAGSRPVAAHLILAAVAVLGYLASSATIGWIRARRGGYLGPMMAYGAGFTLAGLALLAAHPELLATLIVLLPALVALVTISWAGHPRSLAAGLAQVTLGLVLVPAAAIVAGSPDWTSVGRATLAAGAYLVGAVLVVRSLIRERGNNRFAALSIGCHLGAVAVEAILLPLAYALLAVAFTLRAAALPALRRRLADGLRRVRPVHLGLIELTASTALVVVAWTVRF